MIKILTSSLFNVNQLGTEESETLFYYLPLAVQLIDDDLSIENCNGITGLAVSEQREEYLGDVSEGRKIINSWINSSILMDTERETTVSSALCAVWEHKLVQLKDVLPADYRVGEAFVKIMTEAGSRFGKKSSDEVTSICRDARAGNAIRSASWLAVLRQSIVSSSAGTRLCNELVADLTGIKPEDERRDG